MKNIIWAALITGMAGMTTMTTAWGQVVVTRQTDAQKDVAIQTMGLTTLDRTVVPLMTERKESKLDETTTRSEFVVRGRRNDGSYADWLQATTTTQQVSPGVTESTTVLSETDRQGKSEVRNRVCETITKLADGQKRDIAQYGRNSSGHLVLASTVLVTTQDRADGSTSVQRVEQRADVNGKLVPMREVNQTITEKDGQKIVNSEIRSYNHIEARFQVAGREVTTVRSDGNVTRTETELRERVRSAFETTARAVTTETVAADGTRQSETVQYGRAQFSKSTGNLMLEPLQPQRKIVEKQVRKTDGTIVVQRDVYRRSVNGDWVPTSFTTGTDIDPLALLSSP